MKHLLATTALAIVLATPALAGPLSLGQIVNITGYSTPDGAGFNSITTTALGAPDTPYSYYTGPIVFSVQGGPNLTVYCVDLNHWLQTGVYQVVNLDQNGEGQSISEFDSNRIGHLAELGAAALGTGNTGDKLAAAAQAAIWDIGYSADSPTSTSGDGQLSFMIGQYNIEPFANTGYALALRPYGVNWPDNPYASQQMVFSAGSVPEPSTWAMGLMGFALIGAMGYRKRWTALRA